MFTKYIYIIYKYIIYIFINIIYYIIYICIYCIVLYWSVIITLKSNTTMNMSAFPGSYFAIVPPSSRFRFVLPSHGHASGGLVIHLAPFVSPSSSGGEHAGYISLDWFSRENLHWKPWFLPSNIAMESNYHYYPLVTLWLLNNSPWYRWPIEIDGLPIKNCDFPWLC